MESCANIFFYGFIEQSKINNVSISRTKEGIIVSLSVKRQLAKVLWLSKCIADISHKVILNNTFYHVLRL